MEVTMFQGRTDHITVETGGTKDECWLSLKIKNNGEFTLHTCAGDLYELGVKIAEGAIAMGAEESGENAVAMPPKKMAPSTDDRTAEQRKKKSS